MRLNNAGPSRVVLDGGLAGVPVLGFVLWPNGLPGQFELAQYGVQLVGFIQELSKQWQGESGEVRVGISIKKLCQSLCLI